MPNEEYQRLLRAEPEELRERLPGRGRKLAKLVAELDDGELRAALRDLGGHDPAKLIEAYRAIDHDRPTVVFAYTIKGWALPIEGHPENHSALLTREQMLELAQALGADADEPWAAFDPGSPEGELCAAAAAALARDEPEPVAPPPVPAQLGRAHRGQESTQQAFGRFFADLVREAPEVAERVVTVSPDVASSTNLGGWLNKVGIWSVGDRRDWFADDPQTLVHWHESTARPALRAGHRRDQPGRPAGRAGRDLEPLRPAAAADRDDLRPVRRARARAVVVRDVRGRPVDPGGDAERRVAGARGRRPSVDRHALDRDRAAGLHRLGAGVRPRPRVDAAARARRASGAPDGESAYFRLSTRPIDQALAGDPPRELVLAGGYSLRRAARTPARDAGGHGRRAAGGARRGRHAWRRRRRHLRRPAPTFSSAPCGRARASATAPPAILDELFPADRAAPLVTVLDGDPHALAFLAAVNASPLTPLGVTRFGQSGDLAEVYEHHEIDAETIVGAALDLSG